MNIIFLGPPGSGKGTQAKRITGEKKWPQLSTGDMLRSAISAGTQLGKEAKSFMDQGGLVPDAVVIGLIRERSQQADCASGFILDGFPRTAVQAEALDELLNKNSKKIERVVFFKIPDQELVARLSGRRTCVKCGAMYHVTSSPSKKEGVCDQCGSPLTHRDDDQVEVIQKRIGVYHAQTAPVAEYYRKKNILREIDATQSMADVQKQVELALK